MDDCIFCKIVKGEIPSKKIYEDDKVLMFYDLEPQAPVHFLAVPKIHIESADALTEENCHIVGYIFLKISEVARKLGLQDGYRIVNNIGKDGGQTVMHMHFHVLGKKEMGWPPFPKED